MSASGSLCSIRKLGGVIVVERVDNLGYLETEIEVVPTASGHAAMSRIGVARHDRES